MDWLSHNLPVLYSDEFQEAVLYLIIRKSQGVFPVFPVVVLDCKVTCLIEQRNRSVYYVLHTAQVIIRYHYIVRQGYDVERCYLTTSVNSGSRPLKTLT